MYHNLNNDLTVMTNKLKEALMAYCKVPPQLELSETNSTGLLGKKTPDRKYRYHLSH